MTQIKSRDCHAKTAFLLAMTEGLIVLVAWKATLQRQYKSKRTQQWKKKF
ncbi:MAG: hypothetical protein J6V99_07785 [Neisseriaceae bacterium]|nr:hypothetical protein [Neisseriaceae bacterium]